jgi:hypothetical protein
MADQEFDENDIRQAIESENVEVLRAHWYDKVKAQHERKFVLLGQLEDMVAVYGVPGQAEIVKVILSNAKDISSEDMYIAMAKKSYTKHATYIRKRFRLVYRHIEKLKASAIEHGQTTMVELLNEICDVQNKIADTDCFRLLLNGYLESRGN